MTLICLEIGKKRVFASALEWPGWCRSGRTEEAALEALDSYLDRYSEVVRTAGLDLPDATAECVVAERLPGDMSTDFGAPGAIAALERERWRPAELQRLTRLLQACWTVADQVTATTAAQLRKGPRGGGRDRDAMVDHVLGAETAYARKIGVRHRQPARDNHAAIAALRGDLVAAVLADGDGGPTTAWPPAYAVRRTAWHVLDHAWEMQDRAAPD